MKLPRTASRLIAFYPLTSVATASAECAWVLWTKAETAAGPGSTDWGIVHATPSRADCIVALERTARGLKDVVIVGDIRAGSSMAAEKASSYSYFGKCLPDTGWTHVGRRGSELESKPEGGGSRPAATWRA